MKKTIYGAVFSMLMLVSAAFQHAQAAELVMLEQDACPWCERWHAQIGPIYPKTSEGKLAPLRQVNIHKPLPSDLAGLRVEPFTPSFVLMEDGIELGRIRGYPGEELFWWLLSDLIKKLPDNANTDSES